jgi:predicted enzyme related to lactoylglutathione lyase
MADRKLLPGKFVWYELVTPDPKRAQAFYGEVLGWTVRPFPVGSVTYEMIYTGDTMIGGYRPPATPARWISCVSVEDVDAAVKTATASGAKVLDPPSDIPTVGRQARIADPQGAEIVLFRSATGDAPDEDAPRGAFFWNELHTPDPAKALAFYEKVVGFSHRSMDMGPSGAYHIVARGGVDRGGATHWLAPGANAHWLPYVRVDDPDGTIARARKLGATIPMNPEDIPGVGRFGILQDPTGAALAIMRPNPREK